MVLTGYHAYNIMDIWTPVEDEMLRLIHEPTNSVDGNAVAVMKEGQVVGHVPFNLSPIISLFLRRDVNKAFARVTGGKVPILWTKALHLATSYVMLLIL